MMTHEPRSPFTYPARIDREYLIRTSEMAQRVLNRDILERQLKVIEKEIRRMEKSNLSWSAQEMEAREEIAKALANASARFRQYAEIAGQSPTPRRGRPPLGDKAMTGAERKRKHRAKTRGTV